MYIRDLCTKLLFILPISNNDFLKNVWVLVQDHYSLSWHLLHFTQEPMVHVFLYRHIRDLWTRHLFTLLQPTRYTLTYNLTGRLRVLVNFDTKMRGGGFPTSMTSI